MFTPMDVTAQGVMLAESRRTPMHVGGLQLFAEPALFDPGFAANNSTGGSDRQFQTLVLYMYEKGFRLFDAGYAATVAWMLFLVVVLVAIVNFSLTRRIAGKG
jgi:cellobiose transport system permease protein